MTEQQTAGQASASNGALKIAAAAIAAVVVVGGVGYYLVQQNEAPAPSVAAVDFQTPSPIVFDLPEGNMANADATGGFTRLSSTIKEPWPGAKTGGARIELSPALEEKFSGKTVEVIINARTAPENGSGAILVTYSTAAVGNSGWQQLPLKAEFSDVGFRYDVPARKGEPGNDYIGIVADPSAGGKAVDVKSVQIRIVPQG